MATSRASFGSQVGCFRRGLWFVSPHILALFHIAYREEEKLTFSRTIS